MSFPKLNFPEYEFKIRRNESRSEIFDEVRKKWLVITPEEWVRQHTMKWLTEEKKYPASLMAVEKSIVVNGLTKRCDIVSFDKNGKPILIVECKSIDVEISQSIFDQAARYNLTLNADLFLLTNGLRHFCCKLDYENKNYIFLKELPNFSSLNP